VVVLRTFSKIFGLAGFRVGYAVAHPSILAPLEKIRMPFNVSALSLVAAEAALDDKAFVARARKLNSSGMRFWQTGLKKLGIPYWPSQGNFLLIHTQEGLGLSGPEVFQACLRLGVILRPVANYGMPHALRVSVGTEKENRKALAAIATLVRAADRPGKAGKPGNSGKGVTPGRSGKGAMTGTSRSPSLARSERRKRTGPGK
jgi:histidinol-phosphate aminotransferase